MIVGELFECACEPEPEEDIPACPVCGEDMEIEICYQCGGDCGRDLYEENPIEYEPGEWERCDVCDGLGYYRQCPNVPHTATAG